MNDETITWEQFRVDCARLAAAAHTKTASGVWGIPTGGSVVALDIAARLDVPVLDEPREGCLVVDDLVDSGRTMKRALEDAPAGVTSAALYRKPHSPDVCPTVRTVDGWLRFPWEHDSGDPTDAVIRLLEFVGEDPTREGLLATPRRVTRALTEMTAGYHLDAASILSTTFEVSCDEMVVVRAVPFSSLCEHHVLPFTGHASLAYIPNGRVVGLSKLARLVDAYARRLQLQERMTAELADALVEHLHPQGVGVLIRATHTCMSLRGIQKQAEMVTSALRGLMLHAPQARQEFMALAAS